MPDCYENKTRALALASFAFFFLVDYSCRLFIAFSGVIQNLSIIEILLAPAVGAVADFLPVILTTALTIFCKNKITAAGKALIDFLLLTVVFANATSLYIAKSVISLPLILPALPSTLTFIASMSSLEKLLLVAGLTALMISFKWYLQTCLQFVRNQNSRSSYELMAIPLALSLAFNFGYLTFFKEKPAGWLMLPAHISTLEICSEFWYFNRNAKTDFALKKTLSENDKEYLKTLGLINPRKADERFDFKKIVVISVESLDLAYLHSSNSDIPAEATMNLDLAVKNYLSFNKYYTAAQPSIPARHAMLASRLDYYLDDGEVPSVFSEFGRNGFTTCFISAGDSANNMDQLLFDKRFKPDYRYFSEHLMITEPNANRVHFGVDSDCIFNKIISLLKATKTDERIMIFAATIDTHPPYGCLPPVNDPALKNEKIRNSPFLLCLTHFDRYFGAFLKYVKENGLLDDDTLIVITSDHTSVMGENYTNRPAYTPDLIPLIFITRDNKLAPYFDSDKLCSQIDLPATLLAIQGYQIPATFMGSDIRTKPSVACISNSLRLRIITPEREEQFSIRRADNPVSRWYQQYY